ncbi:MAG: hypothetical protein GY749_24055 [Desulfobacteraceae bacterium]|nr:hypothetical protein [Desulfobacteraceae bacterium]
MKKNIYYFFAIFAMLTLFFSCKSFVQEKADLEPDAVTGATKVSGKKDSISQDQVKQKVRDFLKGRRYLSLATVDALGKPVLRSVVYVNKGDIIYFLSRKDNKVSQVAGNPNVAFNVDYYDEDWNKLQSVQMQGMASVIEDGKEKDEAMEMLLQKFKQYAAMSAGDYDSSIIRIKPVRGLFIDNPAGYGTRYEVVYDGQS